MSEKFSDQNRQQIANKRYSVYGTGDIVDVGSKNTPKVIGTLKEVITYDTGRKEVQR